uniref:oligosaccharide flippase family protein n=1 Tax=Megamonas funiformis TaxID=437897 RepID=UPI0022E208A9
MGKNIGKNYLYNLIYQILLIISPLITTPYISRVLEPEGVGLYSYTNAIVSYFILFATMGITIYGQREISYVQDNKDKRSQVFWNVKLLSIVNVCIWLIIYYIY